MENPPFAELHSGPFSKKSTAEEVTQHCDLSGKTFFVTGVNSGFGLESTRVLAMRGATVFGAARTIEKARIALATIPGETVPVECELSDPESITRCAAGITEAGECLDALLCNAGVMMLPHRETVLGVEKQMFVNTLGHYLLIDLLKPALQRSIDPRVVITSSLAEAQAAKLDLDDLGAQKKYDSFRNYKLSKLANNLLMVELSRRYQEIGISVNCVEPGAAMTGLERHMTGFRDALLLFIGKFFMSTIEECTATQVYLATSDDYRGVTGHFFGGCQPRRASRQARDEKLAHKFVSRCDEILRPYLSVSSS